VTRKLGQIIPRGKDRWMVRISLGCDQATGRRRYFNRTVTGSHRSAQQFLSAQILERAESRELVGGDLPLNQYLDRWLTLAAKPRVRAKTFRDYESMLARYIRPVLGTSSLGQLAPLYIQSAYQEMLERKLSPRTVRYTHSVLHSALEQAVKWRMLVRNAATGVALPRVERTAPRVLTVEETRRLVRAALETPYGAIIALAVTSGVRPSEALAARFSDISWLEQTITIERTLVKARGWHFEGTKRPASRRQVKLQNWVTQLLREKYQQALSDFSSEDPAWNQIFRMSSGQPVNSDYLGRELKRILADAGLPQIRLYGLRHTAASLALAAGAPVKALSEQLGHANTAFTLDTYAHLLPHVQSEAVRRTEALLAIAPSHRKPPVSIRPDAVVAITA